MPVRISKNRVALENIPLNESKGADIASAGTVNLDSATGNLIHLTGTTTITAITLSSGYERTVIFDGSLTLTHNATTLILPGNANITTAAHDRAIFRGDGSGNVRCISYVKADGTAVALALRPSFSVHKNAVNQSIPNGVSTKVTWSTELFDSNNNFAASAFTPTVAGRYSLHAGIVFLTGVAGLLIIIEIRKNGNPLHTATNRFVDTSLAGNSVSAVVDANGTTDYFEIFVLQNTGGAIDLSGETHRTWFNGSKID